MKPYVINGYALDHDEDSKEGNRKRVDLEHAARRWHGREEELKRVFRDAMRKGYPFTAFCASETLARLER